MLIKSSRIGERSVLYFNGIIAIFRRFSIKTLLIGSLSFAMAGCSLLPQEEEPLKVPLTKPVQAAYKLVKAEQKTFLNQLIGNAVFESVQTKDYVFSAAGARLTKRYVQSGTFVTRGQLLMSLSMEGLDLQLKSQRLVLERAKYQRKQQLQNSTSDADLLAISKLEVELEQTKYDQVKALFDQTQIRATEDGQVVYVAELNEGAAIDANVPLVSVADPQQLHLAFRSTDTDKLKAVNLGAQVDVLLDGGTTLTGNVVQTPASAPNTKDSKVAEKNANTLFVQVSPLSPDVKIGQNAQVTITLQKKDDAIVLPKNAVRRYMGSQFVKVMENKLVREYDVQTGLESDTEIEILSGVKAGQQIVLQN